MYFLLSECELQHMVDCQTACEEANNELKGAIFVLSVVCLQNFIVCVVVCCFCSIIGSSRRGLSVAERETQPVGSYS